MNDRDWATRSAQSALAERLLGEGAKGALTRWFSQQTDLITDRDFATEFFGHIKYPGTVAGDYNHRLVQTGRGSILGGIRFLGGDRARSFVEVLAHGFGDDLAGLADAVAGEWSVFEPRQLRLLLPPPECDDFGRSGAELILDQSIHVARCTEMTPPDGRVRLRPFQQVAQAICMVTQRYQDVTDVTPELGKNLTPASAETIEDLHKTGNLHAIEAAGQMVGLLAITRGKVAWIEGHEIMEEVILSGHKGHGYAAAAQTAWAAGARADALLVGTIDRLNHASRKTAQRAGRKAALGYYFYGLPVPGPEETGKET